MKESVKEQLEGKELQKKLIQSQINQTKLIKKQILFNEILAVATIVLAFGFILTFFKITLDWKNNSFITGILIFASILFILFIIVLLCKAIQYLFKLSKK